MLTHSNGKKYGNMVVMNNGRAQDGVAPQCKVIGIPGEEPSSNYGRVYIPNNFSPQNFADSHLIKNYKWIFSKTNQEYGYVKKR